MWGRHRFPSGAAGRVLIRLGFICSRLVMLACTQPYHTHTHTHIHPWHTARYTHTCCHHGEKPGKKVVCFRENKLSRWESQFPFRVVCNESCKTALDFPSHLAENCLTEVSINDVGVNINRSRGKRAELWSRRRPARRAASLYRGVTIQRLKTGDMFHVSSIFCLSSPLRLYRWLGAIQIKLNLNWI